LHKSVPDKIKLKIGGTTFHPLSTMLINKTFHDLPTKLNPNGRPIRIFVISPVVPDYPHAKFPGKFLGSNINWALNSTQGLLSLGAFEGQLSILLN
jgi:hypothetical protein